ncbi:uncharacterized protein LOC121994340 [Zingiber officinale]|uniref:uncharacterized protein LOC121994340 n=1 Tax=Zingiber officinale TaxID=94328 RepID=UPI001C4C9377|nr:uncharacterized protein LOC121994340 [Zingiber officinale]
MMANWRADPDRLEAPMPMADAVQALIDLLVDPLLPASTSPQYSPAEDEQLAVAKQMHSVVLLYNYYHRKQFPQLEFLDFRSFCKQATMSKRSLLSFMKFTHKNVEHPLDSDRQLSILEKEIMTACDIAATLDASENSPDMEGWPVSKVAVLLVDANHANCYLEFGSITQGIKSLPEKRLDKPIVNTSKSFESLKNDVSLKKLAFSAVQQKPGDCCSKLSVLENHLVYSLSDEKTMTVLYIMETPEVISGALMEFPIKDVLNSLRGPLFRTGSTPPEVTSVVEYYHLLPYVDKLLEWLSRVAPHSAPLNFPAKHPTDVHDLSESPRSVTIVDHRLNKSYLLPMSRDETAEGKSAIKENMNRTGKSDVNTCTISKSLKESAFTVSDSWKMGNNSSAAQLQPPCLNKRGSDIFYSSNGANVGYHDMVDGMNMIKKSRKGGDSGEISSMKNASKPFQNAIDVSLVPVQHTTENPDEFKPVVKQEHLHVCLNILQKRRDDLVQEHQYMGGELAQCEMAIQAILVGKSNDESAIHACNTLCSSQMHTSTSTSLPSEDKNKQQEIRIRRFSEAILRSKNSCQELNDICSQNGWIMPMYAVFPSIVNESFQATVSVRGIDFEANVVGDFRSNPDEARLSAATNMVTKLHNMADQQNVVEC